MEEYQKRVVIEKEELEVKISSLLGFVKTGAYEKLEPVHQMLLTKQVGAMKKYKDILVARIELFELIN